MCCRYSLFFAVRTRELKRRCKGKWERSPAGDGLRLTFKCRTSVLHYISWAIRCDKLKTSSYQFAIFILYYSEYWILFTFREKKNVIIPNRLRCIKTYSILKVEWGADILRVHDWELIRIFRLVDLSHKIIRIRVAMIIRLDKLYLQKCAIWAKNHVYSRRCSAFQSKYSNFNSISSYGITSFSFLLHIKVFFLDWFNRYLACS